MRSAVFDHGLFIPFCMGPMAFGVGVGLGEHRCVPWIGAVDGEAAAGKGERLEGERGQYFAYFVFPFDSGHLIGLGGQPPGD